MLLPLKPLNKQIQKEFGKGDGVNGPKLLQKKLNVEDTFKQSNFQKFNEFNYKRNLYAESALHNEDLRQKCY